MTIGIALRVDVDTRRGLDEGVPGLLELFRRRGIRASFFVTMGPDRSGVAIRRAWRPSFALKMWRSRAWRLYGIRTMFSGTLLRVRQVGAGNPALLRQIFAEGHEVAPHGFDHVGWQDYVHRWDPTRIRADLVAAADAYETATGARPEATAAPGWRTTPTALAIQEELGYRYASDVRGAHPFRPNVGAGALKTIQLPTTMPTVDELLGRERDIAGALERTLRPGLNVLTIHAEVEGGPHRGVFEAFLERAWRRSVRFESVGEAAERALTNADALPVSGVTRGRIAGRSGWVAVPGTDI